MHITDTEIQMMNQAYIDAWQEEFETRPVAFDLEVNGEVVATRIMTRAEACSYNEMHVNDWAKSMYVENKELTV